MPLSLRGGECVVVQCAWCVVCACASARAVMDARCRVRGRRSRDPSAAMGVSSLGASMVERRSTTGTPRAQNIELARRRARPFGAALSHARESLNFVHASPSPSFSLSDDPSGVDAAERRLHATRVGGVSGSAGAFRNHLGSCLVMCSTIASRSPTSTWISVRGENVRGAVNARAPPRTSSRSSSSSRASLHSRKKSARQVDQHRVQGVHLHPHHGVVRVGSSSMSPCAGSSWAVPPHGLPLALRADGSSRRTGGGARPRRARAGCH